MAGSDSRIEIIFARHVGIADHEGCGGKGSDTAANLIDL